MKVGDLIRIKDTADPAGGSLITYSANLKKTDKTSIVTVRLNETGIITKEEGDRIFIFLTEQQVEVVSNKYYWELI